VEEIQRLQHGCNDLIRDDLESFGKKMFDTHDGLSRLYEVSCPEADALVDMVRNNNAVFGARMMGGGFGGCTINIVKKENLAGLIDAVTEKYSKLFERQLKNYIVNIDEGTSIV
jgi:galactokinase